MSPSLKLAEVTPSTITPELKQELIDILLRRRRRLYGITDDSVPVVQGEVGGGASATAAASSYASTSPAQLVPDLPPDAKPDPSRMVITSSTAAQRRSIRKGAKFQTLPARSSASLAPIKDMLAGRLALQQPEVRARSLEIYNSLGCDAWSDSKAYTLQSSLLRRLHRPLTRRSGTGAPAPVTRSCRMTMMPHRPRSVRVRGLMLLVAPTRC